MNSPQYLELIIKSISDIPSVRDIHSKSFSQDLEIISDESKMFKPLNLVIAIINESFIKARQ